MVALKDWKEREPAVVRRLRQLQMKLDPGVREIGERAVSEKAERLFDAEVGQGEKERLLAELAFHAGPQAAIALHRYLADPDPGLEDLAGAALESALALSPSGGGYDRNSPCPCGSGSKWKHCCGA